MAQKTLSTSDLTGKRVLMDKSSAKRPERTSRLGKVRSVVFHPRERRVVGFIVKRPDLLWMFHRRDLFVALTGFDWVDGRIVVRRASDATGKGACKALGINYDDCVLWVGMPVIGEDGTNYGLVGDVTFDATTGDVITLSVTQGATANALLGVKAVPAALIRGFRRGIGTALAIDGQESEEPVYGAILVSDEVAELDAEGGLAEKAGEATAVVAAKAGEATAAVAGKAREAADAVKPAVSTATKAAGKAVNAGAYATGRQIKRASGMFAAFKEEYDKARHEDD